MITILIALSACSTNNGPTATEIAALLVHSGDLPHQMTGGRIETISPAADQGYNWGGQPRPRQLIRQVLVGGAPPYQLDGRLTVWHFRTRDDVSAAFKGLAPLLYREPAYDGIGEQSESYNNLEGTILHSDYIARSKSVMFTRCTVLVEVDLRMAVEEMGDDAPELTNSLAAYARKLDQRLAQHVC